MDFLPGALPFTPQLPPEPELAADVVWFDAFVLNVDRTPRNPNLLRWHHGLWLIDHGAALYVHHAPGDPVARAGDRFPAIRDHVLLPFAGSIAEADARLAPRLDAAAPARDRRRRPRRLGGPRRLRRPPRRAPRATARASWRRPTVPGSPFQYAMLRVVPRVERGEAFNAGVALFCRPLRYLGARPSSTTRCSPRSPPGATRGEVAHAAGDAGRGRRGAARGRPHRHDAPVGALPLDHRAVEHDRAALGRAHRPHRATRRPSWRSCSRRSSAAERRRARPGSRRTSRGTARRAA